MKEIDMKMIQGNIESDEFCKIIIDTLKSGPKSPSSLKGISKKKYTEYLMERYNTGADVSDSEYYYRLRRLISEDIVVKAGGAYMIR